MPGSCVTYLCAHVTHVNCHSSLYSCRVQCVGVGVGVGVCVCLCVHVGVGVFVHTYMCICMCMYVHVCIRTYVRTHVCPCHACNVFLLFHSRTTPTDLAWMRTKPSLLSPLRSTSPSPSPFHTTLSNTSWSSPIHTTPDKCRCSWNYCTVSVWGLHT